MSTLPWFDSSPFDKRRWIFPDLFVPSLISDMLEGRDRALETALSHVDERTLDDKGRMFPSARATQKGEWRPFWRN